MADKDFLDRERAMAGCRPLGNEKEYFAEVIDSGNLSGLMGGKFTERFETMFAEILDSKYAVAMSTCMATSQDPEIHKELGKHAGAPTFQSVAFSLDYNYRINEPTAAIGISRGWKRYTSRSTCSRPMPPTMTKRWKDATG